MIGIIFWYLYLTIEGLYDAYMYRFSTSVQKRTWHGIHIPHLLAMTQRILVSIIITYFSGLSFIYSILLLIALWLMLPLIQTGYYMEGQYWLTKLFPDLKPLIDVKGKPYRFFGFAFPESSAFPDKNPVHRALFFVAGLSLYLVIYLVLNT